MLLQLRERWILLSLAALVFILLTARSYLSSSPPPLTGHLEEGTAPLQPSPGSSSASRKPSSSPAGHFPADNYVILSIDDNIAYSFFAPALALMWPKMGFKPIFFAYNMDEGIMTRPATDRLTNIMQATAAFGGQIVFMQNFTGYVKGVPEMTSRYFACSLDIDPDAYVMLSDMDMLPMLKQFFDLRTSEPGQVSLWNAFAGDLGTHGSCYIGMSCALWREVMGIGSKMPGSAGALYKDVQAQMKKDKLQTWSEPEQWAYDQRMFSAKLDSWSGGYKNGRVQTIDRKGFQRLDRSGSFWEFAPPNTQQYVESHNARPVDNGCYGDVWPITRDIISTVVTGEELQQLDEWYVSYLQLPALEMQTKQRAWCKVKPLLPFLLLAIAAAAVYRALPQLKKLWERR